MLFRQFLVRRKRIKIVQLVLSLVMGTVNRCNVHELKDALGEKLLGGLFISSLNLPKEETFLAFP